MSGQESDGAADAACLDWRHRERIRRSDQESKINVPYTRISENVLFAALLATVVGWTAVSLAADQPAASTSQECVAAATGSRHS